LISDAVPCAGETAEVNVSDAETEFFEASWPFAVHSALEEAHAPTERASITMLGVPEESTLSPTMTVPPGRGQQQAVVLHAYPSPIL